MLLETTLSQLHLSTVANLSGDRVARSKEVRFSGAIECTAVPPGILFSAETVTKQRVQLRVLEVRPNLSGITIPTSDGETIVIDPIKYQTDNVQLSCTCEDFTFRLARANSGVKVLFGSITKPYIKKTSSPSNTHIGVCKHTMKLIDELKSAKVIA